MSGTIRHLTVAPAPEPDPQLIADMSDLLDRAKKGELTSFAYAATTREGAISTGWNGGGHDRIALCAAVSMLSHRYHAACLSEDTE